MKKSFNCTTKNSLGKKIADILDLDLTPYNKYLSIKNNKYLTNYDLGAVLHDIAFGEHGYEEIKQHMYKIRTQKLYNQYLSIKDDPLTSLNELLKIRCDMPSGTKEFEEVFSHINKLKTTKK